ncbi:MAG: PDZ domain-containing protein [Chloroflexota bacterium]|nr:PDZ domain-containing protein [Chloroflexota bacterium]
MKEFLSQRNILYTEKYVDRDRDAAIEMVRRSGQQGVPVTVIGDQVIVGFDRPRLERAVAAMREAGPSTTGAGTGGRRSLGAKVADAGRYVLPGGTRVEGAFVGGINPGSPAERAGLKVGDVVVAVDDLPVASVDELSAALGAATTPQVKLTLARGTTRRDVTVQF